MVGDVNPVRVVIADDVAEIRLLARAQLEASGRFVVVGEASDGAQAVELARSCQPQLVLLDLSMPIMDGLEALPRIRAAAPDAQVVVFSSHTDPAVRQTAFAAGAVGYLDKRAVSPGQLAQAVADLIKPPPPPADPPPRTGH